MDAPFTNTLEFQTTLVEAITHTVQHLLTTETVDTRLLKADPTLESDYKICPS